MNVSRILTGRRDEPGILAAVELESQVGWSWHDRDKRDRELQVMG